MKYNNEKHVILDLFGKNYATIFIDFPKNLDTFVRRLPPGNNYTTEYFISAHTIAPLFGAFLSSERYALLTQKMSEPAPNNRRVNLLGGYRSFATNTFLRYCVRCVQDDRDRFGETFWHRAHQLPFVFFCAVHEIPLTLTNLSSQQTSSQKHFIAAEQVCDEIGLQITDKSNYYENELLQISFDVYWLLHNNQLYEQINALKSIYFNSINLRYGQRRKDDLLKQLTFEIRRYFGINLLLKLGYDVALSKFSWLDELLYKETSIPIHHLLLMHFLHLDVPSVFQALS